MSVQTMADRVVMAVGIPKGYAHLAVTTTIAAIVTGLVDDGEVVVTGLGRFTVQDTPARMARNPRTGEAVAIPAQRKVKFRPAKALKDVLNP